MSQITKYLGKGLCVCVFSCPCMCRYRRKNGSLIIFVSRQMESDKLSFYVLYEKRNPVKSCACVCVYVFCSGYDFGYLIKILSNANLPEEEVDFFEILRLYFPVIYDVKYLMKSCKNLKVPKYVIPRVAQGVSCVHLKLHTSMSLAISREWLVSLLFLPAGRPAGSSWAAGAGEDRTAASGRLWLPSHRHGLLQDERGDDSDQHPFMSIPGPSNVLRCTGITLSSECIWWHWCET